MCEDGEEEEGFENICRGASAAGGRSIAAASSMPSGARRSERSIFDTLFRGCSYRRIAITCISDSHASITLSCARPCHDSKRLW